MQKLYASLRTAVAAGVAVVMALAMGATLAAPASANSAYSTKHYFSGSTYTWAYAYIDDKSNSAGCGNYNSWVKLANGTKPTQSIKNTTTFRSYGLGSITAGGVSSGFLGGDVNLTWTNTNGATGSYLSGSVCGNFAVVYIGMSTTGVTVYNGTTRTPTTPWL
jgi:hypothetical protein